LKKVLIITAYWPPAGGAGVQRWLKFTKYLRNFGWEPVIYTPENSEIPVIDNSLFKDIPENIAVIKQPIWEPYNIYKLITFSRKKRINVGFLSDSKKPRLSEKLSVWIRSNFFIPDARCFWIKPSVKFLTWYLSENPVDVIISSGPPHSMHLIALNLIKEFKVKSLKFKVKSIPKWVADFRDAWTQIDFYKDLRLTSIADKKHHRLELEVLKYADVVVTVGKTMGDEFETIHKREYKVITNGFDTDDTSNINIIPDSKFSIAHIGSMPKTRNPHGLWKVLKKLVDNDKEFASKLEIKLVGNIDFAIKESINDNKLDRFVNVINYLPHDEVIKVQKQTQLLLLIINQTENAKTILTGKFFEYLASKRPILCIGPVDGEVARIINETNSGKVIDYNDEKSLWNQILQYFNAFKQNELKADSENINMYSRKELTGKLVEILNNISKE
jgi:hypothetical protein